MINGEDTREESSGVPSLDLLNLYPPKADAGGDASPVSSLHYSSCGESEFERYCSANSVMGTPSMCSSTGPFNDCAESEFGSLMGGCVYGDATDFETFSLGPSLKLSAGEEGRSVDQGIGPNELTVKAYDAERISMTCGSSIGMRSRNADGVVAEGARDVTANYDRLTCSGNGDAATLERDSMNHLMSDECQESLCGSDSQFGGSDTGREDGSSIDAEHSDGNNSIFGTDDGCRSKSYYPQNAKYGEELKAENGNPFLINSSTAFGSDDWDDFELENREGVEGLNSLNLYGFQNPNKLASESEWTSIKSYSVGPKLSDVGQPGGGQDLADVTASSKHAHDANVLKGNIEDTLASVDFTKFSQRQEGAKVKDSETSGHPRDARDDFRTSLFSGSLIEGVSLGDGRAHNNQTKDTTVVTNYLQSSGTDDILEMTPIELGNKDSSVIALNTVHSCLDKEIQSIDSKESMATQDVLILKDQEAGALDAHRSYHTSGPLELLHQSPESGKKSDSSMLGVCPPKPLLASQDYVRPPSEDCPSVADALETAYVEPKTENTELNDFYDDFVHDMEEILLDSGESSGARFSKGDNMFQLQLSLPQRDGGQTATTSGLGDSSPVISQRLRIDGVEVVGAKQKKGDVSLSERLVGVKEYTVYIIRVWSGKDRWEVERRYRDFYTLYRRLTSLFADQGWTLPTPWASVERESRKIFGTSPNVIAERSVFIQECLNSVLLSRCFPIPPNVLLRFLSPQDTNASSPKPDSVASPSGSVGNAGAGTSSTFGNTISLIVEVRTHKSVKQLLEAQHYVCAGCHRYFDDGVTVVRDFVKALGWGRPRLCEYTGQLFCSSCHTNETTVLPARVLHHWDFSPYPVSQLAKSYLDSIHEQPMLCVSAVNPFLFSKVPALNHVMNIRKRIGAMLPNVRCPFRKTLNKRLGPRSYLLESTDFFALRDLIDLSKGAFAALPVIVETISRKVLEHITEQCLVCCDVGVPCNARRACDDTSSLIFPFQEDEVSRCPSCGSVFHSKCFKRVSNCHCGAQLGGVAFKTLSASVSGSASVLPVRFLSSLFSKTKKDNKEPIILMGSMPSNDL